MMGLGSSSGEQTRLFIWDKTTFDTIWPDVELILLQDKKRWDGYYTLESLRTLPQDANVYVWTFHDPGGCVAVLYTQLAIWPVKIICRFLLAAATPGKGLPVVRQHLEFIELWAKRSGASEVEIIGRMGWLRVMPEAYRLRAVHLVKNLEDIKEH